MLDLVDHNHVTDDLFARRDLVLRGVDDGEIRSAKRSGSITTVRRGWYVARGAMRDASPEARHVLLARATLDAGGDDLVLSHESAAVALGLTLWHGPSSIVHVSVDGSSGSRQDSTRYRHATRLDEEDVDIVNGIRVTTPARTVADLACTLTFEAAVCAGDSAMRLFGITRSDVEEALGRCSRRRGIARARRAIEFMDGLSESVGESRSRVYVDRHGLPTPELQVEIVVAGRTYRPDLLWKDARMIGEFDGMSKYTRGDQPSDEVVMQEKLREDALRSAGWNVQRWMWKDLVDDRLAQRLRGHLGL